LRRCRLTADGEIEQIIFLAAIVGADPTEEQARQLWSVHEHFELR
jgi:hypothetical protein